MKTLTRKLLAGATAAGLVLGVTGTGIAGADSLEGDELTAVRIEGSLNFGTVCVGDTATKSLNLVVRRTDHKADNPNTYKGGSTVTVTYGSATPTGVLSSGAPSGSITLPANWATQPEGTLSNAVTATVSLNTSVTRVLSNASVTFRSSGTGGNDNSREFVEIIPVTGAVSNTGPCAVAPPPPADTTAPKLTLPTDITKEATGANGAPATWTATAEDVVDGNVTVNCDETSGTVFPLGDTTVNCSATDAAGNKAEGSFTITVLDTTAPKLTLPTDITKEATGANGATASWTAPTATDAVDGTVPVTCDPASGSTFALGTHTVTCSATDAAGNEATGTFTVKVQYASTGILQPINTDATKARSGFRQNSTIPVKVQLTGASAAVTNAQLTIRVTKTSNGTDGTMDMEPVISTSAHTGNLLRYSDGQYIFNLSAKTLSIGQYRIDILSGADVLTDATINIIK